MTNAEMDQLVKRANAAGHATVADYAVSLEALLNEAVSEYADHQSWRCAYPPHYYLVDGAKRGYEGCPCGLDDFWKRVEVVLDSSERAA